MTALSIPSSAYSNIYFILTFITRRIYSCEHALRILKRKRCSHIAKISQGDIAHVKLSSSLHAVPRQVIESAKHKHAQHAMHIITIGCAQRRTKWMSGCYLTWVAVSTYKILQILSHERSSMGEYSSQISIQYSQAIRYHQVPHSLALHLVAWFLRQADKRYSGRK